MTDLRDVIARAIYASDFDIPAGELEEQWAWSAARSSYQNNADTVLAVLADLPDDVIEQAAGALDRNFNPDSYPVMAAMFRDYAVTAFRAVFGGEQS